jgi:hypothetical protein
MNRELPKPLQDALARQAAGAVHPAPDLLTAFAEHSLPARESQRVTDHLAQCADCREVVFLASSAVEEPVSEEQEWMPADAISRLSPALRAKAAGAGPTHAPPRRRWMLRWAWVPAVTAVLVVSALILERRAERMSSAPVSLPSKEAPLAETAPQTPTSLSRSLEVQPQSAPGSTTLALKKPLAKSLPSQANQAQAAGTVAAAKVSVPGAPEEYASAPTAAALPPAPISTAQSSLDALLLKSAPAVPTQNSFTESASSDLVVESEPFHGNPQMAKQRVSIAHTLWHITPNGYLERWSGSGNWTRVLAEQPVTFHVVSVVGDDVWAGGSGGALFHSSDGGQNWSKVTLAAETGTVMSIRFSDAEHGVVTTDGGAQWGTFDGGVTWTKE